jgi:hypothetical protein
MALLLRHESLQGSRVLVCVCATWQRTTTRPPWLIVRPHLIPIELFPSPPAIIITYLRVRVVEFTFLVGFRFGHLATLEGILSSRRLGYFQPSMQKRMWPPCLFFTHMNE